jgi:pimeloyl-ACP methyl ester carboxylesterase
MALRSPILTAMTTALLALAGCGGGADTAERPAPAATPTPAETAAPTPAPAKAPRGDRVSFKASDGRRVSGAVLRSAGRGAPALVLVHMLDGGASQWDFFQPALRKAGFTTLAYDGRGGLDETELLKEVRGAVRFLRDRGARRVGVVGASIGATTALLASAKLGAQLRAVVALSPADSPVIINMQGEGSYRPTAALLVSDKREKINVDNLYAGARHSRRVVAPIAGHGTVLLGDQTVRKTVLDWLGKRLR